MAKIDVSKIEGYESMSAEDKLKALEAYEFDDGQAERERLRNAVSKANSEAADWKKKHNALLSEDEKKAQESADRLTQLEEELETLRSEKFIAEQKAELVSLGYSDELAQATAVAMRKGDIATVLSNQRKFLDDYGKKIKAEQMGGAPLPPAGQGQQQDYAKQIAAAQSMGDDVSAASYIRAQQKAANPNINI